MNRCVPRASAPLAAAIVAAVLLLPALTPAAASANGRWLHVQVVDGGDETSVNINVPVSMARSLLDLAREEGNSHGGIRFDNSDEDRTRWRRVMEELDRSPEGTDVRVPDEDGEDEIWASRRGRSLQLRIEERGAGSDGDRTLIRVPMALARLGLEKGEIEEADLLRALEGAEPEEILIIENEQETRVRIWIDQRSGT